MKDQWEILKEQFLQAAIGRRGIEEREKVPEKACGKCKHFSEKAYSSDGSGYCRILKAGSDITADPPVYVTEGDVAYVVAFNTDASKCKYYEELEFIDHDARETADPFHRRVVRQLGGKG